MWIVPDDFKIIIAKAKDVLYLRVEFQLWERAEISRQLQLQLLNVVVVDVGIAEGMYKITYLELTNLGHHMHQKCVRCDVERHAQENICTALVQLAAELTIGHIKLEECMTWRQRHLIYKTDVPSVDDDAAAVGIVFDLIDDLGDLVHMTAVRRGP